MAKARAKATSKKKTTPRKAAKKAPATRAKTPRKRTPKRASNVTQDVPLEALQRYVRVKGQQFLDDPNVTSVGIGHGDDGGLCVQFTVAEKVARNSPERLEEIGTKRLPESLDVDGAIVPTQVIERTYRPAFELLTSEQKDARKVRQNPLMPGISVSHPSGTAGTLGAIVYDRQTGAACMLSNWHVLHTGAGKLGDPIVQPGPHDDNRVAQNEAGTLMRSHLGPAGDCAIARIENRTCETKVLELGTPINKIAKPELGDVLVQSGRTTGVTHGVVRRIDVTAKISYDGVGEQKIGGFEIGPLPGTPTSYEVSMGGDSGSAWLIAKQNGAELVATDIMAGLHFAGETNGEQDEHALACYASSVFEKLEISLEPVAALEARIAAEPAGYVNDFLGVRVNPPKLSAELADDAVEYAGSPLIPYTHFSVCLSRARRFAHFAAWMIDGQTLKKESRKALKFKLDPRIDEEFQVGDELYAGNKLDRGHLARRADLIWGSRKEAQQANLDSFYFTNITPQHESYNQSAKHGLWGELENAVFDEVEIQNQRLVVFGGSIFKRNDPEYRDVRIPRSFWKVIAFIDAEDEQLKAKAYVLTQDDLLDDIEAFELDPFRMYQVSLVDLERRTGVEFGTLRQADTFRKGAGPEAFSRNEVREILSRREILF